MNFTKTVDNKFEEGKTYVSDQRPGKMYVDFINANGDLILEVKVNNKKYEKVVVPLDQGAVDFLESKAMDYLKTLDEYKNDIP